MGRIYKHSGCIYQMEFQTEKPAISYIHFDFFYCLAHTFNAIEILDKREFFLDKKREDNRNVDNYRRKAPA